MIQSLVALFRFSQGGQAISTAPAPARQIR
jgi:hypothetical protein